MLLNSSKRSAKKGAKGGLRVDVLAVGVIVARRDMLTIPRREKGSKKPLDIPSVLRVGVAFTEESLAPLLSAARNLG